MKTQQSNLTKVQEEQIQNLKNMLNQTINVKIKYENIIKKLVENDKIRDLVLSTIETISSSIPVSPTTNATSQISHYPTNQLFMRSGLQSSLGATTSSMT